jgi:hypothetical protein
LLTTSQVDRLGERLRSSATITEVDLVLLQQYRAEHSEALRVVQETIDAELPGVSQTSRVKTVGTLHDKLRRQSTKLSRVHDIAGVRVVEEVGLAGQDDTVARLLRAFPGAVVKDRRKRPMHGYRAAHVIARVGRCWVEIQVRTEMQHLWAEIVERLGDRWGRQIRYGGLPAGPSLGIGGTMTRRDLWEGVLAFSKAVAHAEEVSAAQDLAVDMDAAPEGMGRSDIRDLSQQLHDLLANLVDIIATDPRL